MTIKSKLTKTDFINVHYVITYRSTPMKILMVIFLIYFLSSFLSILLMSPTSSSSGMFIAVAFLTIISLQTYFRAKNNFGPNNRICEQLEYNIENDNLLIKGESFNSQLTWEKFHRVTKTKNWLLIWQNSRMANPIPRRDITNEEIDVLRTILNNHQVKNNL